MARGDGFSVYKPSGRKTYRIEFKEPVQGQRIHAGYTDKTATIAEARRLWHEHERAQAGLPVAQNERLRAPIAEAVDLYLADLQRRRKSAATCRHHKYKIRRLITQCGWKALADVRADSLTQHLATLVAASTANVYRDSLYGFLEWCIDQGWLAENPVRRVRRSEADRDRPFRRRALTPDELRPLLAVAGRHHDRYLCAGLTGLRSLELGLVEKRDFDLVSKTWVCRPEVDKTRRYWQLPILPDLLPALAKIMSNLPSPNDRLFPKGLGNGTFNVHLRRAGIVKIDGQGRRVNFHSLRYFFCTLLAHRLPIQQVKQLMRHADIRRTINLYMDLGLTDLSQAVAELPPLFNPEG